MKPIKFEQANKNLLKPESMTDEDYECCTLPDYACPRKNECCTYTDITSLVADVNVNEIAEHIRCGNLDSWVQSWQQQMAFELENAKLSEKD
jgi:hypothetical protein